MDVRRAMSRPTAAGTVRRVRRTLLSILPLLLVACGRTALVHTSVDPLVADGGVSACQSRTLTPFPAVPSVLLVVDRSGSMAFDLAGHLGDFFGQPLEGPTRWEVLFSSLSTTLAAHEGDIAFGLSFFPGETSCGAPTSLELPPAPGNAQRVLARFGAPNGPGGGTPTFAALERAASFARDVKARALVLVTDGEPNCNAALDRTSCRCTAPTVGFPPVCSDPENCSDVERAVDGLRRLRVDDGLVTFVVGVGSSSNDTQQALHNLAVAGGMPRAGAVAFYSGATAAELDEALEAISTRLERCSWSTRMRLDEADVVTVSVGGEEVPVEGWRWSERSTGDFALRGAWCERAAHGAEVRVTVDCR